MKRFPASLPRRMYLSKTAGGCTRCPECSRSLEQEGHTYVLAVREDGEIYPFIVGTDKGNFCEACPVVVLDEDHFAELAMLGLGRESAGQFVVLGIVDLDAVPDDKRSLPFNDDDNPIPLVQFTSQGDISPSIKATKKRYARRKQGRRRSKRHR